MEKRKVFKISIIDKEISRTEFDRNTFYTSDSELSLVFKLIEKDYTYEHGEILLYNENDESFVTRKITKQDNDFVYELDLDIIPHYGKWQAQLQLVNDGDVYTSKPFDFSIVNDLSNLAPQPTLTDINNWYTLKASANELIDEMQGVIVDLEKDELERVNKENLRQQDELERVNQENYRQQKESERVKQENKRQQEESERVKQENKRETQELKRQMVFDDNEGIRKEKEVERQQAESQRQSTFETNESERQTTFETNETGRQTTFETAEQGRQSAESIRVENENQRKIDHANRSAELAGKADKVVLKNEIENGDFTSYNPSDWLNTNGTVTGVDGKARFTLSQNNGSFWSSATKIPVGHKFYTLLKYKQSVVGSYTPRIRFDATTDVLFGNNDTLDNVISGVSSNTLSSDVSVRFFVSLRVGNYVDIDEWMIVDLTETFGAGNEPTKEEMDELIKITGYIDGEYALNNKEMLIWTLALIRRNKNAIVTLGGTI